LSMIDGCPAGRYETEVLRATDVTLQPVGQRS